MKTYNQFLENKKTDFFLSKAVQAIEYNGQTVESFIVDFCEAHCLNETFWNDYKGFWKSLPGRITGAIGRLNLPPHQSGIESLNSALQKFKSANVKADFVQRLQKLIDDMNAELQKPPEYSSLGDTSPAEAKPKSAWDIGTERLRQQAAEKARKEKEAQPQQLTLNFDT